MKITFITCLIPTKIIVKIYQVEQVLQYHLRNFQDRFSKIHNIYLCEYKIYIDRVFNTSVSCMSFPAFIYK